MDNIFVIFRVTFRKIFSLLKLTVLVCVISGWDGFIIGMDLRKKKSERGKLVTLHNVRTVVKPDQIIRVL